MKYFTIFNQKGQILRSGVCHDEDFEHQAQANELILEGKSDPILQYIVNNTITLLPAKTNEFCQFDYDAKQWVTNFDQQGNVVKNQRFLILSECDWTQSNDSPLTAQQKTEWATYRQALRDITKQSGFPANVIWPTPPQG